MKHSLHRRCFIKQTWALGLALPRALRASDPVAPVSTGTPTIVRTHELMAREPNRSTTAGHLWRLHQSATSRTNLVEMRGEAGEHLHPDAEHSLYVISGEVTVRAGDIETTLKPGEVIRGFTFALLIGIVIGTYSSICIATPIVVDFAKKEEMTPVPVAAKKKDVPVA